MNKDKIRYRPEEVEQAIQWIKQFNPYYNPKEAFWSDEKLRASIMDSILILQNHDTRWVSTAGYTILKCNVDGDGFYIAKILLECGLPHGWSEPVDLEQTE